MAQLQDKSFYDKGGRISRKKHKIHTMPDNILGIGLNAANTAIGAGMGLLLEKHNDKRQLNQQAKLQAMQIAGQKDLTDYNTQKQMEMWKNTSYPAQMEMLKQAGLNPGLIYGMGGGGGQSTNIAQGNIAGADAPKGGGEAMGMGMQMMQAQMIQSQIELAKAQANKANAEAGAIPTNVEKTGQEIINLKTENALKELERAFNEETYKNRATAINLGVSKLIEEVSIIENEREISDATKKQRIQEIGNRVINIAADTQLKHAQTAQSEGERQKMMQEIENLKQQWDINRIDQEMAKDGMNPKAGNLLRLFHNLLRGAASLLGR